MQLRAVTDGAVLRIYRSARRDLLGGVRRIADAFGELACGGIFGSRARHLTLTAVDHSLRRAEPISQHSAGLRGRQVGGLLIAGLPDHYIQILLTADHVSGDGHLDRLSAQGGDRRTATQTAVMNAAQLAIDEIARLKTRERTVPTGTDIAEAISW